MAAAWSGGTFPPPGRNDIRDHRATRVDAWLDGLASTDIDSYRQVVAGIEVLADVGPSLGWPLVDRVKGSTLHGMKALRTGSRGATEIRVLFVVDPWRIAILLVGSDTSGTGRAGTGQRSRRRSSTTVTWRPSTSSAMRRSTPGVSGKVAAAHFRMRARSVSGTAWVVTH